MSDSLRDQQSSQPSVDAATVASFTSLSPVPEAEATKPPVINITSQDDVARMGFTDSQYDAAVAVAPVDADDEQQHQVTTDTRLPSYSTSSRNSYTLEDDLRAMNDQMKRVLAFCETQRENPLQLQTRITNLKEQLRQAIAEKNYWMKRCKDLTSHHLTGHQPSAAEASKVDLQDVKKHPRKRSNSELILIADTWAQPGRDGIYSEDTSSVVESDVSSCYSEAEVVDDRAATRSCFRLLQCSDEQCEVFNPTNRNIRTHHRSRNNVQLMWDEPPKSVLIVKKPNEPETTDMLVRLAPWLHKEKNIDIFLEPAVHAEISLPNTKTWGSKPEEWEECQGRIDFVISLGGDGTVLWVSSLFRKSVPPVFSLAMGSLGFLTPFHSDNVVEELTTVIDGGFYMSLRSRLACTVYRGGKEREISGNLHALNEIVIERGSSGALVELNCFCDGLEVTKIAADGIIIATPTGSTAYSLSAGGSMAHPSVPSMLFTPICPHTLSFRPLIFHDSATLKIEFPVTSRASACCVSFDGKNRVRMKRGDSIVVRVSSYPLPSICRVNENQDWFESMITNLSWNQRRAQKPWQPPVTSKM
ncbi:unnamed protein product [Peronospora destructor]|uniref:Uncharacterized protein n=1 Tax=Peronospora destructor TaxID=86335 RepID=A0AAV0V4V4_9STRA|nr:unnamed protein product [Peronospora destructor]